MFLHPLPMFSKLARLNRLYRLALQNAEAERAIVDFMTHLENKAQRLYEQVGTPRGRREDWHETTDAHKVGL